MQKLECKVIKDLEQLKNGVLYIRNRDPKKYCAKLIENMIKIL